ncbi:MAG: AI-2E family transporter [Eubacteriales Family XIII. Incertae Sedis bacterium]|nr:MAG: AI-2E family transporter [Clostridiales Family XIII bacterium]
MKDNELIGGVENSVPESKTKAVKDENIKDEQRAKILSIAVLVVVVLTIWYMMDIVFITFILVYLFYNLLSGVQKKLFSKLPFNVPNGLVLALLYIVFIGILVILGSEVVPKAAVWVTAFTEQIINFDIEAFKSALSPRLAEAINNFDLDSGFNYLVTLLITKLGEFSARIGSLTFSLIVSMLLSFVIVVEKDDIVEFGKRVEDSKISFIYNYFMIFGGNFCKTFGKVMKVQLIIALVNSALSMIGLKFIGFEAIVPFGVMIFVLGLIPVAGVIISLFPLCIMAFNIGGIIKIVEVCIMVCVLHAIEAYILNPKLMSAKTRLPVCFVFIILLVGEHYMGVWGLIMGVPIFIFIMSMFDVDYAIVREKKQKLRVDNWRKKFSGK